MTLLLNPLVIVGSGLAAWNLIREYRKQNPEFPIVVITADDGSIYPKPQISVALSKKSEPAQLVQFKASEWSVKERVIVHTHTNVTNIDTQKRIVFTDQNQEIHYEDLVLATGASPITIPLSGTAAHDVLRINNLSDYQTFRDQLVGKKSVSILGSGLIGTEFATDLITSGYQVNVIAPDLWPMGALVPDQVGLALQKQFESLGVQFFMTQTAKSIDYNPDNSIQIELSGGEILQTDLVLAAIGLTPNIALAQSIGLKTGRGIIVNKQLQTSQEHIYALGDGIEIEKLTLPFVMPIVAEAKVLAQVLSGQNTELKLDALPVIVKCTPFPLVIGPDWTRSEGTWGFDQSENGIVATKRDKDQNLLSVVLTQNRVTERNVWFKQLPAVV